jgi:hypothetical protein
VTFLFAPRLVHHPSLKVKSRPSPELNICSTNTCTTLVWSSFHHICTVSLCFQSAPSRSRASFYFRIVILPSFLLTLLALAQLCACVPVTQQHNTTPSRVHHHQHSLYYPYSSTPSAPVLLLCSSQHLTTSSLAQRLPMYAAHDQCRECWRCYSAMYKALLLYQSQS